jgi:hypothetical protein
MHALTGYLFDTVQRCFCLGCAGYRSCDGVMADKRKLADEVEDRVRNFNGGRPHFEIRKLLRDRCAAQRAA